MDDKHVSSNAENNRNEPIARTTQGNIALARNATTPTIAMQKQARRNEPSAIPIPVLPLVGSMSVSPGRILPELIASSTILTPILSLTEPPGLRNSHLASTVAWMPSPRGIELSRTKGVFPTAWRMLSKTIGGGAMDVDDGVLLVVVGSFICLLNDQPLDESKQSVIFTEPAAAAK